MKKIKFVQLAMMVCMLSVSFWSCDNNYDAGIIDNQTTDPIERSTRNGSTFRVIDTDYAGFMDGSYNMDYVISEIQKVVGFVKPANKPFLLWLGEKDMPFATMKMKRVRLQ